MKQSVKKSNPAKPIRRNPAKPSSIYDNIRLGEFKSQKRNGSVVVHPLLIFGDPTMPDMLRFSFGKSKATQVLAAMDEMGPQKFRDFLYEFVEQ